MRIALRIDVSTCHALMETVPLLADILRRRRAGASFVVSLGPDRSGRALGYLGQPARLGRPHHGSLADEYGWHSLPYGLLLPARNTGRRGTDILHRLRDEGFEIGLHGWDAQAWTTEIGTADAAWSEAQFAHAIESYRKIFSTPPKLHAAPGWRMNPHALRLEQRLGFAYASDTRGRHPFVPVWNGEIVRCPQFPTTLPTLEELAQDIGGNLEVLRERTLALSAAPAPFGHVFALRAAGATARNGAFIEELLTGWHEQGHEVISIQSLAEKLDVDKLPRHEVMPGTVPGRHGTLLMQGDAFLSTRKETP